MSTAIAARSATITINWSTGGPFMRGSLPVHSARWTSVPPVKIVCSGNDTGAIARTRVTCPQNPALTFVNAQSVCAMPLQSETTPPPAQPRSRLTAQNVNRAKLLFRA